jgi:hypothetical protein
LVILYIPWRIEESRKQKAKAEGSTVEWPSGEREEDDDA